MKSQMSRKSWTARGVENDLRDDRVRAAFAMAPGDIQGFGMDEAGLRQMAIPAYIIVGAGDTATPPKENAEFAAKYIPHAQPEWKG
jgi:predicted dienelactone hydrolase